MFSPLIGGGGGLGELVAPFFSLHRSNSIEGSESFFFNLAGLRCIHQVQLVFALHHRLNGHPSKLCAMVMANPLDLGLGKKNTFRCFFTELLVFFPSKS